MIIRENNELIIDGINAKTLVQKYGTPLYVLSKDSIVDKCTCIKNDFLNKYPNSRAAYASKAFLTKSMCKIIENEGFCLDVVSIGELYTAIKAGFPAERIEVNGNNKSIEEIEMAVSYGVGRIIIDATDELSLIEEACEKFNKKIKVLIRVSPGVDSHTHKYITTGNIDSKFGIPLDNSIFNSVFKNVLNSSYVELVGFHFHVGSQLHENDSYLMATDILLKIIKDVKNNYDFITKEVNIGGGFGIRYTDNDNEQLYSYFLDPVMEKINSGFDELCIQHPAVVIEPGRSIVANAGVTLYSIGTIKDIPNVRKYVSVDGGMTDNIRPALYGAEYECQVLNDCKEKETVSICGKCCESGDILVRDALINSASRGDILAIFTTGAYCYSMSSNYNKIPLLPVVQTSNNSEELIVRRQTLDDLISREL